MGKNSEDLGPMVGIMTGHEKTTLLFQTRPNTSRAVQSQEIIRGLKICNKEEELYYPCSEKGTAS